MILRKNNYSITIYYLLYYLHIERCFWESSFIRWNFIWTMLDLVISERRSKNRKKMLSVVSVKKKWNSCDVSSLEWIHLNICTKACLFIFQNLHLRTDFSKEFPQPIPTHFSFPLKLSLECQFISWTVSCFFSRMFHCNRKIISNEKFCHDQ